MSDRWAVRLASEQAAAGGRLRMHEGVEVLPTDDAVWLRGDGPNNALDDALAPLLRALPTNDRFTVLPDGQLVRRGASVPQGHLPQGNWQPIRTWFQPELGTVGLAGEVRGRHLWTMRRAGEFQEPNVLLAAWQTWHGYAIVAPQVRLKGCRFAVNQQRQVVVCGAILPPLAGQRYVARDGIAVAVGWQWHPPLAAGELREWFGCEPAGLVLLHADGTADLLVAGDFVPASRSAVRETNLHLASLP